MSKIPMYQYKPVELAGLTIGKELKFIRKLRKLSVEALAQRSGLPVKTIKAAEEDSITLSTEQIERLALAADCHPSSIAFPLWSSIAYEPEQVTVREELRVNDSLNSTELKLFLSKGYGLMISGGNRKSVQIYVFNIAMTSELEYALKEKTEIQYEISGDVLGTLNDTYQSGTDYDGDNRIIKNLDMQYKQRNSGTKRLKELVRCGWEKVKLLIDVIVHRGFSETAR